MCRLLTLLLCLFASSGLTAKNMYTLTKADAITLENTHDSNIVAFLNQYVLEDPVINLSVTKVKKQASTGYKTIELNFELDANQKRLDFDLLKHNSWGADLQYTRDSGIRLYHNLPNYVGELKSAKLRYGVILYVKFKNQVRGYPLVNLYAKSFPLKTNQKISLYEILASDQELEKGKYWLEVGPVAKKHLYITKKSL